MSTRLFRLALALTLITATVHLLAILEIVAPWLVPPEQLAWARQFSGVGYAFIVIGIIFLIGAVGIVLRKPLMYRLLALYTFIIILAYIATRHGLGGPPGGAFDLEWVGVLTKIDEALLIATLIKLTRTDVKAA